MSFAPPFARMSQIIAAARQTKQEAAEAVEAAAAILVLPSVEAAQSVVKMPPVEAAQPVVEMPPVEAAQPVVEMPPVEAPSPEPEMPVVKAAPVPRITFDPKAKKAVLLTVAKKLNLGMSEANTRVEIIAAIQEALR